MDRTEFSAPYHTSSELLPGQEISVTDLDFYALLRRQSSNGSIYFNQRRAVLFDVEALGALRQQLVETVGQEMANGVLMRFGYSQGYKDADTLAETFNWKTEADWLAAGPTLHMLEGIVQVKVESLEFDRDAGHFNMQGTWHNSYEAEEYVKQFGKSDTPVCFSLAGYASGYATRFLGRQALAIETKCVAKGDDHCAWEVKPLEAWDKDAASHLNTLQQVNIPDQLATIRRLEKQKTQLAALNQISAEFNLATSSEQVFAATAAKTPQIVNANRVSITLLNPDARTVDVFALNDETGAIPQGSKLQISKSRSIGQAIKDRQVVINHKIQSSKAAENIEKAQHGFHSSMVAPLITGEGVIGTLNIASKTPDAYDEQNKNIFLQLAALVAAAIEKQRLMEQTQQRATELEESTTFLNSILDNIPAMIFVKEAQELRFARWNKAGEKLVGFKNEDMMGKNDFDFFPKEEAEFFVEKDRDVLNSGQLLDIPEESIQTATGEVRWLHTKKVPVMGADGKPSYLLGISEDITGRKRFEDELKKFKLGIERSNDAVFLTDVDGTITYVNAAFEKIYGFTAEEAIGKTPRIIKSGLIPQEGYVHFWQTLLNKQVVAGELVNKSKTGKLVNIEGNNSPIVDDTGKLIGFLAVHHDITERKEAEASLSKRATQLSALSQASLAILNQNNAQDVYHLVTQRLVDEFDMAFARIWILDKNRNDLVLQVSSGEYTHTDGPHGRVSLDSPKKLAWIATQLSPHISNDLLNDPRLDDKKWAAEMDMAAFAGYPLLVGNELLGVLGMFSHQPIANETLPLLQSLATLVGSFVSNQKLFSQLQQRATELQIASEVGVAASTLLNVNELLQTVVDLTKERFNLYHAHIYLLDENVGTLTLAAGAGDIGAKMVSQGWSIPFKQEKSLVARSARTRQGVIVNDVHNEPGYLQNPMLPKSRSELVVPIMTGDKLLGVLDVQSEQLDYFNDEDVRIQSTLATQVAVSLQNARLFTETTQRAANLELLSQVSRRISTVLDPRQLIKEVVEQIDTSFDYYYTQIYLMDQGQENLILASGMGDIGQLLSERQYSLPNGQGLVGRAAKNNEIVLVPDARRHIGAEIITQANLKEVYQREVDPEVETKWYAHYANQYFGREGILAKNVFAEGEVRLKLGYVWHLPPSSFTAVIQRGIEAAARDLQVDVEFITPARDYEHKPLFEEMVQQGIDGLVVVPDRQDWVTPIQEAMAAGIPVVTANVELENSPALTHVSQDNFLAGMIQAQELTKKLDALGKNQGKILVANEMVNRVAGFKHGLHNSPYTLVEMPGFRHRDLLKTYWKEAIADHPDLIAAVGLTTLEAPILAEIKRRTQGEWLIFGFDLALATLEAIEEELVQGTIGQHPYLQGYLPILALVERLRQGKSLQNWITEHWLPTPHLPETETEIAVPIALGDRVLGVLDVQHNVAGTLNMEITNVLSSITGQVAVALQNASLFEQAQTRARREQMLREVTTRIRGSADVDTVMRTAVQEVGRALGRQAFVYLGSEDNGQNGQPSNEEKEVRDE